ncbi:mevalonate kinase-like [Panicum miliaceum]|uniref:Mevalonate kinase-like n=1 Tax=Panicum miliaceum TaxID=4540 RepID=A0A3L6R731_PANMI|nr:mevalonate kinase-like [Panicum miliaceum]
MSQDESLIASATTATSDRVRGSMEVHALAAQQDHPRGRARRVYGSAATAGAIDLYTTSSLRRLPAGEDGAAGAVELDLRDSGLTFSWPCSHVRAALGRWAARPGRRRRAPPMSWPPLTSSWRAKRSGGQPANQPREAAANAAGKRRWPGLVATRPTN